MAAAATEDTMTSTTTRIAIVHDVTPRRATIARIVTPSEAVHWLRVEGNGVRCDAGVVEVDAGAVIGERITIPAHGARLGALVPAAVLAEMDRQDAARARRAYP